MNDRGPLTTARRLAEKAGDSVIDLDGCEHGMPLFRMMNDKTVRWMISP
jgi:hypothetical protein